MRGGTPQRDGPAASCPFCTFSAASSSELDFLELNQHVQLIHLEPHDSLFRIRDDASPRPRPRSSRTMRARGPSPGTPGSVSPARHDGASRSRSRGPTPDGDEGDWYFECPWEGCGEAVHIREREHHQDLHDSESVSSDEPPTRPRSSCSTASFGGNRSRHRPSASSNNLLAPPPPSGPGTAGHGRAPSGRPRRHRRERSVSPGMLAPPPPASAPPTTHAPPARAWSIRDRFLGPAPRKTRSSRAKAAPGEIRRLGKSELGPFAFEERMPRWLHAQLARGPTVSVSQWRDRRGRAVRVERVENETAGIVPVLAQLSAQDPAVSAAYLCDPSVRHVFKMPREGGFCGYRNIQMQLTFMRGTQFPGHEHFGGPRLPTVLRLQDMIEDAWDDGFSPQARAETGGIRGTRKYIGTPEAQALFCSLGIGCEAAGFNRGGGGGQGHAFVHDRVLEAVRDYFAAGATDHSQKVRQTARAPIYFQHPGHSLTIVGLEVRKRGLMNLLVFDPMFRTPSRVAALVGKPVVTSDPGRLLKAFRRGDSYLAKHSSFEILKLTAPDPVPEAEMARLAVSERPPAPLRGNGIIG